MACLTHMVHAQIVRRCAGDVEGRKRCLESKAEGICNSLKPQSLKSLKHGAKSNRVGAKNNGAGPTNGELRVRDPNRCNLCPPKL